MERRRLRELDALRGIAALVVLIHHNLLAANLLTGGLNELLYASPLQSLARGRPAVMFFFVLSGFVLTRALRAWEGQMTASRWAAWALQRSIRLGLPVAASLLVSVALYELFYAGQWQGEGWWPRGYLWQDPPTAAGVVEQALLVRSAFHYEMNNVLWSLAHEWRLSLLLPAVAAFALLRGPRGGVLAILIGLAAAGFAGGRWGATLDLGPGLLGHLKSTVYFVLPFAVGVALDRVDIGSFRADRWQMAAGLLAMAGLARMANDLADYAASAILIWLALQPGLLQRALHTRPLQWLGQISFSLYLTHELVIAPLHHQWHDRLGSVALFCLSCAVALPASQLFFLCFERPAHRLARSVSPLPGREARPQGVDAAHAPG